MKKRFVIVEKNHPHQNELCELTASAEGTIQIYSILGKEKLKVELINCPHLIDSCFVNLKGLREI